MITAGSFPYFQVYLNNNQGQTTKKRELESGKGIQQCNDHDFIKYIYIYI